MYGGKVFAELFGIEVFNAAKEVRWLVEMLARVGVRLPSGVRKKRYLFRGSLRKWRVAGVM